MTGNPAAQVVTFGADASFSASASGTPAPTTQWQVDTGSGFQNIPGATTGSLALIRPAVSSSGNRYRAVFTNGCGSASTTAATLTVNARPITVKAKDQGKTYGQTFTFAGTEFSISSGSTVGTDSISTVTLTSAGAPASAAVGPYSIVPSAPVFGSGSASNYAISYATGLLTIGQAVAVCSISGYNGTYDATAHGASGSCAGVDTGGTAAGSSLDLGDSFTDVPGGTAHWVFSGGTNYTDQSGDVAIAIGQAVAVCSISGYNGTYDATAHGATGRAPASIPGARPPAAASTWGTASRRPRRDRPLGVQRRDQLHRPERRRGDLHRQAVAVCSISGYNGTYDATAHARRVVRRRR